ncbi:hypothetical protein MELE44368_08385 [Mycolicibacterium elephantis DSM 44368]|uniref:Uncharacterized protein n=1 Tax=Mycolicibacterium elephantis DSM 44368 TaxID=1335622 RepID=A0A439DME6_9MYCO|nr:hypothetical protein MELE44368_08385 [Mycolicibacterium elephantis DSM 44368]
MRNEPLLFGIQGVTGNSLDGNDLSAMYRGRAPDDRNAIASTILWVMF